VSDVLGRRFENRICIVTGAASGIGRATAVRLAREGASIVVADIDAVGLKETLQLAGLDEARSMATEVDVRSEADSIRLAQDTVGRFGRVDVLVNNAGIEILGGVLEIEPDVWDQVQNVNLRGVYLVSRAILPAMLEAGRGAIVNNASLMGLVSTRGLAAYCASKAGVVSLTRSMALDFAVRGIRVNCVCPGIIHTPMLERRFDLEADRGAAYEQTRRVPPVQYLGAPEDVAAAIAYLASDEARFVTGAALTIDGGVSAE
jgi:NAD(P)-dependent dehydrogenase (short-subunit alcohol dehydrogenase family)